MAELPKPEHWTQLRARRPASDGALATLPVPTSTGNPSGLLLGMDAAQNLHLLVPVPGAPPLKGMAPDLNGVRVRHQRLETGDVLDLTASSAHEQIFSPVCREVIDAVLVDGRNPWKAVESIIRNWKSAWQPARALMGRSVQVGLFGELFVLQDLMIPCLGAAAIDLWSGPLSERHDFVAERLRIEVKTTTSKSTRQHEISRLEQLHAPEGCQLLLISIQLEESLAGRHSLATLLDGLNRVLGQTPAAVDLLAKYVGELGWTEDMRSSPELLRFNIRDAHVYMVDEEFPRIPADFVLPSGVSGLRYTVDLANLPTLDMDEVRSLVRSAQPV